jgi:hypothetical protein
MVMEEPSKRDAWNSRLGFGRRSLAPFAAGLGLFAALLSAGPASASPIISNQQDDPKTTTELSLGQNWLNFLAGGPSLWAVESPPPFPSGLVLLTQNGQIIETPFVDYLIWRRNLDPARFDHFHPNVGPVLGQLTPPTTTVPTGTPRSGVPAGTPRSGVPTGTPRSGNDDGTNPQPQNGVPEPGMLPIALTLTAVAFWWKLRPARSA